MTSEFTDSFYTRLNFTRTKGNRSFYIRSGYSLSKTYAYSGNNVYTTTIDTYTLDSQFKINGNKNYRFVSAVASVRDRDPILPLYGGKSGYYMVSTGYGRTVSPGLDAEIALAATTTYDEGTSQRFHPVASLRWKSNLTSTVSLNSRANFVGPFSSQPLFDSYTDLTYKFAPALSLRFSYLANNLLKPLTSRTGWDKSFRVSLVFSSTTW